MPDWTRGEDAAASGVPRRIPAAEGDAPRAGAQARAGGAKSALTLLSLSPPLWPRPPTWRRRRAAGTAARSMPFARGPTDPWIG